MRVLVIGDREDRDLGLVGERLTALGGEFDHIAREDVTTVDPAGAVTSADLVVHLGSANGVADPTRADNVAAESAIVQAALDADVPVMGICYGAQLTAHALGGVVSRADDHEIGWYYVESHDPALCPPGPWLEYHYDRFTVPDGARLLGQTDVGPQGFAVEDATGRLRLVAWQFHPEVDLKIIEKWIGEDHGTLPKIDVDGEAIVEQTREREDLARAQTHALVDVALDAMGLVPARL